MRRLLANIFRSQADFEVAVARDGIEGLAKLHEFQPDVMTLDIHMPNMDGLACLDRIMLERPTRVIMLSSLTEEGADETFEAMQLGAVDFVPSRTARFLLPSTIWLRCSSRRSVRPASSVCAPRAGSPSASACVRLRDRCGRR